MQGWNHLILLNSKGLIPIHRKLVLGGGCFAKDRHEQARTTENPFDVRHFDELCFKAHNKADKFMINLSFVLAQD
jgi:hypothetical protein